MNKKSKTLLCLLVAGGLVGCATNSVEKDVLSSTAREDAKQAPKEMRLAYLQCYALPKSDKNTCRRIAGHNHERRSAASSWDYIRPFDYEAERQGFAAFLRDNGKKCKGIDQGPRYDKEQNGYVVSCTDDNQYLMRFDRDKSTWQLAE